MLTIHLFGLLKTLAGNQADVSVVLEKGQTVGEMIARLTQAYPAIAELIHAKKVLISVNHEMAHADRVIHEGDEVALLPPFSGGASADAPADSEDLFARVQRENFSIDVELARVRARSSRIGGIAMFLGTARDQSNGRDVSGLAFEQYEGMAQKTLQKIRRQAITDFGVIEVLLVHRCGDIQIGENIVLVIAAAEHRAEAFRACRRSIDELKRITPIWKREYTPDGEVWVEAHP